MNTAPSARQLAALHGLCFEMAWDEAAFISLMAGSGVQAIIIDGPDNKVAGFGVIRIVLDEAEIITLGVVPARRGYGLGLALLNVLIETSRKSSVDRLFLEVAENNNAALRLYSTAGFAQIGRRIDYYEAEKERVSALILEKRLP